MPPPGGTRYLLTKATIDVAGTREEIFDHVSGGDVVFEWDGLDAFGRRLDRPTQATVEICYRYREPALVFGVGGSGSGGGSGASSRLPYSFGTTGDGSGVVLDLNRSARVIDICRSWTGPLGIADPRPTGLMGWELERHHRFVEELGLVYRGTGHVHQATSDFVMNTLTAVSGPPPSEGASAWASDIDVVAEATDANGNIYVIHAGTDGGIWRIDRDGTLSSVLSNTETACHPLDPTVCGNLVWRPQSLAVGPDGSVYWGERGRSGELEQFIGRVGPDGTASVYAGGLHTDNLYASATDEDVGEGRPALEATFQSLSQLEVASDGTLFVNDYRHGRILRVTPDAPHLLWTVVGGATYDEAASACGYNKLCDGAHARMTTSASSWMALVDDVVHFVRGTALYRVTADGTIERVNYDASGSRTPDGADVSQWSIQVTPTPRLASYRGQLVVATHAVIQVGDDDGSVRTLAGPGTEDAPFLFTLGSEADVYALRALKGTAYGSVLVRRYSTLHELARRGGGGASGGETKLASPDGSSYYVFDRFGRHIRTEDALRGVNLEAFEYDVGNRLISIRDARGLETRIERPSAETVVVTAPYGERTTLHDDDLDGWADRIEYSGDPSGAAYVMTYDDGAAEGLLRSLQNRRGQRSSFTYDALGRLRRDDNYGPGRQTLSVSDFTRAIEPDGRRSMAYSVRHTTELGRTTTYETKRINGGRRERAITDPAGRVTASSEQGLGSGQREQVVRSPDGTTLTSQVSPDPRHGFAAPYVSSSTMALPSGTSVETTVQRRAVPDSSDPFGLAAATVTEETTVAGRMTSTVYDHSARTVTTTTPTGLEHVTLLDSQGRVAESRAPGLYPVHLTYDGDGRVASVYQEEPGVPSSRRTTTFAYDHDHDGSGPDGVEHAYPEAITSPDASTVSFVHDPLGRVTTTTRPDGAEVGMDHEQEGLIAGVVPPTRPRHGMGYDARSRLTSYTTADIAGSAPTTSWSHDADGRWERTTLGDGRTITPTYHPAGHAEAGRVASIAIGAGDITVGYDTATRHPRSWTMPDGQTVTHTLDGWLVQAVTWSGPVAGSVAYAHDDRLLLDELTITAAGSMQTVAFAHDDDGRLTLAGPMMVAPDPLMRVLATQAGSVQTELRWNGFADRTSEVASFAGTPMYSIVYDAHDQLGRITQRTETIDGVATTYSYEYDDAGRLTDVWDGDAATGTLLEHYEYDANGNRLAWTSSAGSGTATYDARDRITSHDGVSYTYNDAGQLEQAGDTSYTYDELGNLLEVEALGEPVVTYVVDAMGRRVAKKRDGVIVRRWLYQDDLNPVAEIDEAGELRVFVYGTKPHVPDLMITPTATYRLVTDHVGSVRLVVDVDTGAVAQRIDYDAFGRVLSDSAPGFQPFAFAGGLYDPDTRLVRFGARDYSPNTGRWLAIDPLLFAAGDTNLYAYSYADPINYTDPGGLRPRAWVKIARRVWNRHIFPRHVSRSHPEFLHKSKFKSKNQSVIEKLANKAVRSPDAVTRQTGGRTLYERDMGRSVGTNGENILRVVLDSAEELVTTFPAEKFKSLVMVFDVDDTGVVDDADVFEICNPGFVSVDDMRFHAAGSGAAEVH